MFCEKCGNKLDDGDLFCANCGTRVRINWMEDNSNQINVKKSSKSGTGIAVAIVLVLFAMVGIYLGINKFKNNDTESEDINIPSFTTKTDDEGINNDTHKNTQADIESQAEKNENINSDDNTVSEKSDKNEDNVSDIFDMDSLSFKFDGKEYTFGCKLKEFLGDWYIGEHEDIDDLEGGGGREIDLYNDHYPEIAEITLSNLTDDTKSVNDCVLYRFQMERYIGDAYPEIILPRGITWESSYEDVVKAYGDPYFLNEEGDTKMVEYRTKYDGKGIGFVFSGNDIVLISAWWM